MTRWGKRPSQERQQERQKERRCENVEGSTGRGGEGGRCPTTPGSAKRFAYRDRLACDVHGHRARLPSSLKTGPHFHPHLALLFLDLTCKRLVEEPPSILPSPQTVLSQRALFQTAGGFGTAKQLCLERSNPVTTAHGS